MIKQYEFEKANNRLKQYVNNTKLELIKNNIFLNKKLLQKTNSFKWSGVLYSVMLEFDNILNLKNIKKPYYLVTQSTGNHGIAVIYAVIFMIEKYIELYQIIKIYG